MRSWDTPGDEPLAPVTKLSFVIGGAQKAGTSTLYALFKSHPQIQMARHKEPHFFDDEQRNWTQPDYKDLEPNSASSTPGFAASRRRSPSTGVRRSAAFTLTTRRSS